MEKLSLDPAGASSTRSIDNSRMLQRKELILRCQRVLFAAYRTDQYADPDGFITSLGLIFSQYPDDVVEFVTSPLTGIQRKIKFPPTIEEIVSACDARVADKSRAHRYRNWGRSGDALAIDGPKDEERPTYDELQAKYGPNFGLGAAVEEARQAARTPAPTAEQLRHHYKHYNLGFKPKQDDAS